MLILDKSKFRGELQYNVYKRKKIMLVYLEEVAVALPFWAFTDDLTDAELSPSSSISLAFSRSSVETMFLVQSQTQPEKKTNA